MEFENVAIRGSQLSLSRQVFRDTDEPARPITLEVLLLTEISDQNLARNLVLFDPDDIDAAFEELDARYAAGEAAAHAHIWWRITQIYEGFNQRELSRTTPDWVNIDHRRGIACAPGDMNENVRAMWAVAPNVKTYIEAVHRLNDRGAVFTHTEIGTSHEGFDAEWREVALLKFDGDAINRCELFDETDLETALARFEELNQAAPRLENDATRILTPFVDAYNRHDATGVLALVSADGRIDDRRKGLRAVHEGSERLRAMRALVEEMPQSWQMAVELVAIRGTRLSLIRQTYHDTNEAARPIVGEALTLAEVGDEGLVRDVVIFDSDDINGATRELTARWIASGEVAHPEVIESARRMNEIVNRHDWESLATLSADATFINHRQLSSPGIETITGHMTSIQTTASLVPDYWVELAEILVHSALGVVAHSVLKGTSAEGFAIELPIIVLLLLDGGRVTHVENFDANQRDQALTRFDELNQPT
jgi:hypothetical protein